MKEEEEEEEEEIYLYCHLSLSLSLSLSFNHPQVWCRSRVSLPPTAAHTLAAHLAAAQGWGCTW